MQERTEINIVQAINSSHLFGDLFPDLSTWQTWLVCLKSIFALSMDKEELKIYRKFTGRKNPPRTAFKEIFLIIGRRGGKSFISALIAVFLAIFKDWTPYLRSGETGWIQTISSDKDQSRIVLNYIKAILSLPQFKDEVEDMLTNQIRLKNNIIIEVRSASWRGLRGYTILSAICDEIGVWRSEESSNPSKEIIAALKPGMATIPESLLIGISTPHARKGVLWDKFQKKYGKDDPRCLVWRSPTLEMNPTIPKEEIDDALKEDYAVGKAEWLAEFREDLESYLTSEMIESVTKKLPLLPYDSRNRYIAFIDMSGGRSDSAALGIAFIEQDNNKIKLARLEEVRAPHDPKEVTKMFSEIIRDYGMFSVISDKYSAGWVESEFRANNIVYKPSELDKSELYLNFQALVSMQKVELLDIKRLSLQLQSLERRVRSGQKDRIDHPVGMKDDVANACAGACVMVSRKFQRASAEELKLRMPITSSRSIAYQLYKEQKVKDKEMERNVMNELKRRELLNRKLGTNKNSIAERQEEEEGTIKKERKPTIRPGYLPNVIRQEKENEERK